MLAGFGVSPAAGDLAGTKSYSEDMEPKPTSEHDSETDVPGFFLYRKQPTLAQPIAQVLTLSGDKTVHRQVPCTIISTSQEPPAATSIPVPAAGVESDVPSLIEDEDYYPRPIVESKVWNSLSEHHSQL